jgi:RimJ/RimL family protein N-acetyltransferase
MFRFVFNTLKLVEIRAYIEMDDNRGWKVAERAGMMYMGEYCHEERQIKLMRFKISNTDFERQIFY